MEHDRGQALVEVIVAIALLVVVAVPVALLVASSGQRLGTQRARAVAAQLAARPPATGTVTESGITFDITESTQTGACVTLSNNRLPPFSQAEVAMSQVTTTVSWRGGKVAFTRWEPDDGASC